MLHFVIYSLTSSAINVCSSSRTCQPLHAFYSHVQQL